MKEKVLNFLKDKKFFLIGLSIALFFIALDQITKTMVFRRLNILSYKTIGIHRHIQVTPFFNLVMVWNKGISFGLLKNMAHGQVVLSVITIAIIMFVLYLLWKTESKYSMLYLSLIIAGAIGNLIDRIGFGMVADFLDFHLGKYHWPAFNIADSIICIGVFMILIEGVVKKRWMKRG